ncbi:Renal dipeptidase [Bacillus pseudomycoides]|uniref:Renal dipeptidase n=1 Tax=Bacillus pseudomycoides TaxID=64104 RepID=A0AA91VBW1_9BACI|nr:MULTISPECIES: nucleotidyltransferase family protein [Bacillus]PEB52126.1 Renal dipeptidase [Bacillus sp. AFS098217]PED82131.1 Renal dipeptidase [Bacillus pseudomycoides]PEU10854.1 Renal dipeptidase [Bacillus sp. AFS019443]PEU20775.1 Renal dipeptidase [Bacillus sp. AFS014408]PFW61282.1 Renal dipeptidase [Bacillus sp. AFS075034]
MGNDFSLNLEFMSKELKLIFEILKLQDDDIIPAHSHEWFTDIDWNVFLELTMHHRVYPLIYRKLKEVDEKLIPSHVVQNLYVTFKKNTFQMLHLSAEMEQVSKLFNVNEIRTLFLKGPVLSQDLYGDISLRTSCDLDILIPISNLEKAEKLLLEQGYVKDDYIQTILNDWKWRHHHITFFHPTKRIKLELHWRLNPGPGKEPGFEELWDRKRKSTLMDDSVYMLGSEDLFLFLASHGARHGWSRLRWLVDIKQIVNQDLKWDEINKLLRKYQMLHLGGQALILASQLLHTSLNERMVGLLANKCSKQLAKEALFYFKQMINLHTDPVPKEVATYHSRHLFSLMSNQQKIVFIMSQLYPYPIDAKTLPLPKSLHFLYFPLRPFLCLWRKTRKIAVL